MDFHRRLLQELNAGAPNQPTKATTAIATLKHSLPLEVQLSLTVVFTALYASLFMFIWIQLILILVYKHKRLSYQSVFLYLCLVWAALRTTLFSFYFNDSCTANKLNIVWKWLLYSFPIVLQFLTLSLLELYFSQVSTKNICFKVEGVSGSKNRYLKSCISLQAHSKVTLPHALWWFCISLIGCAEITHYLWASYPIPVNSTLLYYKIAWIIQLF